MTRTSGAKKTKTSISGWALDRMARDPAAGSDLLVRYWKSLVTRGSDRLDGASYLARSQHHELIALCARRLLREVVLPVQALGEVLEFAVGHLTPEEILAILREVSPRYGPDAPERPLVDYALLLLDPDHESNALSVADTAAALLAPSEDIVRQLREHCPNRDWVDEVSIRALGGSNPPNPRDWMSGRNASNIVRAAISGLASSVVDGSGGRLEQLYNDVSLSAWAPDLKHAIAEFQRLERDRAYSPPAVSQIRAALEGGRPANAADLFAVITELLRRYRQTIRTDDTMPWKRYWNTNLTGRATTPQVENEDRDRLLELLRRPLEGYGVAAAAPEARRRDNTRADMLLLSYLGQNIPVEAKRHYNPELWTAPDDQLRGYASDEGTCGYGVYLVFWFGTEFPVPRHPGGLPSPRSALELDEMLSKDLSADMVRKTAVVVLDVARPEADRVSAAKRKPRKPASGKKPTKANR